MQTKFIKTEDYLLLTSNEDVNKKDWFYSIPRNSVLQCNTTFENNLIDDRFGSIVEVCKNDCVKIIAHLPLNNAPILEGVDWLPSFEEVDVKKLAEDKFGSIKADNTTNTELILYKGYINGFQEGYKTAQAKQYSLDDIEKAIEMARLCDYEYDVIKDETYCDFHKTDDEIIQSLSTQQLPSEFIPSYKINCVKVNCNGECGECNYMEKVLKTIVNHQGQKVVQGEYKFD